MLSEGVGPFTKPPLLQESRLVVGSSQYGRAFSVEGPCKVQTMICKQILFTSHVYTCAVQEGDPNWTWAAVAPI